MAFLKRPLSEMSFGGRLLNVALLWGVPSVCVELIFLPHEAWLMMVLFIMPGTLIGVVVFAALEHWLFFAIRKHTRT